MKSDNFEGLGGLAADMQRLYVKKSEKSTERLLSKAQHQTRKKSSEVVNICRALQDLRKQFQIADKAGTECGQSLAGWEERAHSHDEHEGLVKGMHR